MSGRPPDGQPVQSSLGGCPVHVTSHHLVVRVYGLPELVGVYAGLAQGARRLRLEEPRRQPVILPREALLKNAYPM